MQFIGNPIPLIVSSVVENSLIYICFFKLVDNLNFVEVYKGSVGSTTGDVGDDVGLDAHFHLDELLVEGDPKMNPWFWESFLQHSKLLVDTHIPLTHLMKPRQHQESVENNPPNDDQNYIHAMRRYI